MPLEDIRAMVGNISRLDAMYHGKEASSPASGGQLKPGQMGTPASSGGQLKPGQMGTPAQVAAMATRIIKENERADGSFDPKREVMIDGKRYTIKR